MYCGDYEKDLFQLVYGEIRLKKDDEERIIPADAIRKAEITDKIINDSICLKMAFNFFVKVQKDENRSDED